MAFRLKTYIRVRTESLLDSASLEIKDGTNITVKDKYNRFPPVNFTFPRIFTNENQVIILNIQSDNLGSSIQHCMR